jgi:hypothetical protein
MYFGDLPGYPQLITFDNAPNGIVNGGVLNTGDRPVSNAGLLEASAGRNLKILESTVDGSAGGVILATDKGVVELSSATISGGTLQTSGTGVIEAYIDRSVPQSLIDGGSSTVSNEGLLSVPNGVTLDVQGVIANTGTINLNSSGASTRLLVTAESASLTGAGEVLLSANPNNKLVGTLTGKIGSWAVPTLTNFNTISGAGRIGLDLSLVNSGTIDATGPAATTTTHTGNLVLETGYSGAKGSSTMVNSGVIEATNPSNFSATGGLVLRDVTVNNGTAGEIAALGAHTMVQLEASTISGGSLVTSGGGQILVIGAGSALSGTAHIVQLEGALTIKDGAGLSIAGTIRNTGTLSLAASGSTATLIADVGATLSGAGQLVLSDNAGNLIAEGPPGSKGAAASLTNVDNTVSGAGTIAADLINQAQGLVEATGTNALVIDSGATAIVNNGTLEANGAGGLTLASAVTGTGSAVIASGTLDAQAAFSQNVAFTGATGTLELAQSQAYAGAISGFSHSGGTALDLTDIAFGGATKASYSGTTASGVLTVTDGSHTAHIALTGDYTTSTFTAASDGHGGTSVVDPARGPAPLAQAMAGFASRPAASSAVPEPMRRSDLILARPGTACA